MNPFDAPIAGETPAIDSNDALVVLIELVRAGKANTRADLVKISGLGRSIVSQRVDEAIELGLLEDTEFGVSTGGRMPRVLRFRREIGTFYVADFGARNLTVAITDLNGKILESQRESWDIAQGPQKSLKKVIDGLKKLSTGKNMSPPWAVVIGVPGPVDFSTGKPVSPPMMPGWNDFDIKAYMIKTFGAPCWVENDANMTTLGVQALLRSEDPDSELLNDFLYVKIGSGIGAGIMSRGQVLRGVSGSAGDIGHIAISTDSKFLCRCGQYGCLEAYSGGWALAKEGEIAAKSGKSKFLLDRLKDKGFIEPYDIGLGCSSGDEFCINIMEEAAFVQGEMLAKLVNFLNPGKIVIGGSIATNTDFFPSYLNLLRQAVNGHAIPLATKNLEIIGLGPSQLEGVLGGAILAQLELFSRRTMTSWVTKGSPLSLINTN